ncbi:MAG: DUF3667 domain-containing protein [Ferruginibacter sp.]
MSHLNQRKEDNCLNCNAKVYGRYCHVCGQENTEPAESAWHLITHFFNDITHFDGKFFSTLKWLVFKPGFLSSEYKMGRRTSYLNPVRMYIFTSAIFFFIFFSTVHIDQNKAIKFDNLILDTSVTNKMSDSSFADYTGKISKSKKSLSRSEYLEYKDSSAKEGFHITGKAYKSKAEYDSVLKSGKDHNWLQRQVIYKEIEINKKFNNDKKKFGETLISNFFHSFPQIFFLSLPLFALFLKLLYVRRKDFYYVSHAIFTVHLYIFIFIALLIIMGLRELETIAAGGWINYVIGIIYLLMFFYEYKAMRNFYGQGRLKTITKYILLNLWLIFIVSMLFFIFLLLSFFKI